MKSLIKLFVAFLLISCGGTNRVQQYYSPASDNNLTLKKRADLQELCNAFAEFSDDSSGYYTVKLCADVPDNKNPEKVLYHNQPGHVFLIFTQHTTNRDARSQTFGFYPVRPASTILFKNVKSQIRNNKGREYDAEVTVQIKREVFFSMLDSAIWFARKKYNLNRYNCYDYALRVFNVSIPASPLPNQHVRFPFIWGRGGSPTGLYHTLLELKRDTGSVQRIEFGRLKAPK